MKKFTLCLLALATSIAVFAQRSTSRHITPVQATRTSSVPSIAAPSFPVAARTTGDGDTIIMPSYLVSDTPAIYPVDIVAPLDSGFVSGMNAFNVKGFAQRFFANGHDSSVQVLGAFIYLFGTASATSSKTLNVNVWDEGDTVQLTPTEYFTGFPNNVLTSVSVPFTSLRKANGRVDSFRFFLFPTPTTPIGKNFFVGVDMSYTWSSANGDTVALVTTKEGERQIPIYTVHGADTAFEVANAVQAPTGTWFDYFQEYLGFYNNFIMAAVVKVTFNPTSANSITKNNLTFFGNYPNPAVNSTNIKFGLKNAADVTVTIMDMSGRTLNVINQPKQTAGEHVINVETANMAAGNYMYLIRTSEGDMMASPMAVIK